MDALTRNQMVIALQWYTEQGLKTCVLDEAVNRLTLEPEELIPALVYDTPPKNIMGHARKTLEAQPERTFLGRSGAYEEAIRLAKQANSLEDLAKIIAEFDGIALKKTASNMVFAAGNPQAQVMLVGEAPEADEDRQGTPFAGVSGQLLDRILSCIDLSREQNDPQKSVYLSNILNWRPPGNRTPSPAEIEVSLPFIERHIQLVKPKVLILCGGVAAKALLGREQSISRLRNCWHDYVPVTRGLEEGSKPIAAIATYNPSYLLSTPAQKKLVWEDMLAIQKYLQNNFE
jgi:DNA polymerase